MLTAQRHIGNEDLKQISQLPHLQQLDIMGSSRVTFETVAELLRDHPKLQLLDISYCDNLESPNSIQALKEINLDCHLIHTVK